MPMFALKDINGNIIRYQDFELAAPILSPAKGLVWVREDPPIPQPGPLPVPQSVTVAQARLALLNAGLLTSTNAIIAIMPGVEGDAARIKWEYSANIRRDDPLVAALANALNLTNTQVDDVFKAAILL